MKITPCYRYGLDQVPEVGDGSLYHYTKFDSFLKILNSMTLRSSPLSKMNDLNEADLSGIDWSKEFLVMYNAQKYIRTQCSVISFSQNYIMRLNQYVGRAQIIQRCGLIMLKIQMVCALYWIGMH